MLLVIFLACLGWLCLLRHPPDPGGFCPFVFPLPGCFFGLFVLLSVFSGPLRLPFASFSAFLSAFFPLFPFRFLVPFRSLLLPLSAVLLPSYSPPLPLIVVPLRSPSSLVLSSPASSPVFTLFTVPYAPSPALFNIPLFFPSALVIWFSPSFRPSHACPSPSRRSHACPPLPFPLLHARPPFRFLLPLKSFLSSSSCSVFSSRGPPSFARFPRSSPHYFGHFCSCTRSFGDLCPLSRSFSCLFALGSSLSHLTFSLRALFLPAMSASSIPIQAYQSPGLPGHPSPPVDTNVAIPSNAQLWETSATAALSTSSTSSQHP